MVSVILILSLRGQGREIGLLLSVFVCGCLGMVAMGFLSPVMDFIQRVQQLGSLDHHMIGIILKVVGITLLSEIACLVCADAGNAAMGKGLQFLAGVVVLWLSLPVFQALLDLIDGLLGKL